MILLGKQILHFSTIFPQLLNVFTDEISSKFSRDCTHILQIISLPTLAFDYVTKTEITALLPDLK